MNCQWNSKNFNFASECIRQCLDIEGYDYDQEVARSAFADMLHDKERNQKYEQALISAINKIHARGQKAKVLDIGTGSGLLSMMAARNGADSIVACEAFKPMSNCAKKIIELNGFKDQIKVIGKPSMQLTVGKSGDLIEKCNILVTEVFDTELIGEGALATFSHAHKELLEQDAIVVPDSATVYIQIVECPLAESWNKMQDVFDNDGKLLVSVPTHIRHCPGSSSLHDIQLSQLPVDSFKTIVSPLPVFQFDWSGKTPLAFNRSIKTTVKAERDGEAQCIFMWWDLKMDTDGEIILSCAPHWAHPDTKGDKDAKIPWRDHWIQAVYYFRRKNKFFKKGEEIEIVSCQDEFSFHFSLIDKSVRSLHIMDNACFCGFHNCCSRTRIGQINDAKRIKKFLSLFETHITPESVVFVMSETFYVALALAKFTKEVCFFEPCGSSKRTMEEFVAHNNLTNVKIFSELKMLDRYDMRDVTVVLSEPNFLQTIHIWDNLYIIYLWRSIRDHFSPDVEVFPKKAVFKAAAIHFYDLYKIRSPLGTCEGFDMKYFDKLVNDSSARCDDPLEVQPLWEYPGIALSKEMEIATIDLIDAPHELVEYSGIFDIQSDLGCNGVALWVDWDFDGTAKHILSTGPISPIEIGKEIEWTRNTRQSVLLFPKKTTKKIVYNFYHNLEKAKIGLKVR